MAPLAMSFRRLRMRSVPKHVLRVFLRGAVAEILDAVIRGDSIQVADLGFGEWARADECFGYKPVDGALKPLGVFVENQVQMPRLVHCHCPDTRWYTTCACWGWTAVDHAFYRTHPALITDLVAPLESDNGPPLFLGSIHC